MRLVRGERGRLSSICLVGLVALILASSAERGHWRRSDGKPVDAKLVAAAVLACTSDRNTGRAAETAMSACMAHHGYFSWDGI